MLFGTDFTFTNFLTNVWAIFFFVVWFWMLITIYGDLFRRHDISGWGKAAWVIGLLLFSYIAIIIYLVTQHQGMTERNAERAKETREEIRQYVGFSVADEIDKLQKLKAAGTITDAEYTRMRAKLVG